MDKLSVLKKYFGHKEFRKGQDNIINAILSGQDAVAVMPTGAGKSLCFQVPAMLLSGITIVISPLISLMKDQVSALKEAGIDCGFINSSLTELQYEKTLANARNGKYKILYVAPERLESYDFLEFAKASEISLVAVDEAHCVSQWGQDFRPSYLKISEFIDVLPKRPIVAAFTATATAEVKSDIEKILKLNNPFKITTGFDRPNLYFAVETPKNKQGFIDDYIYTHKDQSGIIYCATRKKVEAVSKHLEEKGVSVTRYHAGLGNKERRENQEDFVFDRKKVMVATNAFGMGIDKSNVSFVIHFNMPKNIESYYQEAGRAGRDGEKAECILLFSAGDITLAKLFIESTSENAELPQDEAEIIKQRDYERLESMIEYCKINSCLRNYLLNYFGEETNVDCENCGNCKAEIEEIDITTISQKILSGIARAERKLKCGVGETLIIKMLHSSKDQRILNLGLDTLSTYGIMSDISIAEIKTYTDFLIDKGYCEKTDGEFSVLRLTPKSKNVLFENEKVIFKQKKQFALEKAPRRKKNIAISSQEEKTLLEMLKELRNSIAFKAGVPAYIVFSNSSLNDMASKMPTNEEEFLEVSGVGEVKAKRYGEQFLSLINNYINSNQNTTTLPDNKDKSYKNDNKPANLSSDIKTEDATQQSSSEIAFDDEMKFYF